MRLFISHARKIERYKKEETMRFVIQRVSSASVTIDGKVRGEIGKGFVVLIGIGEDDTKRNCR